MADQLTLEVATPSRLVIGEQVDEVVVPGIEGYFGVLPGHAPLLSTLGIGELTYRIGRDERHAAVAGGFAEVRNDKVIVLADTAELPAEIDRARADRARDRAEQRLSGRGGEDVDYARAAAALARALGPRPAARPGRAVGRRWASPPRRRRSPARRPPAPAPPPRRRGTLAPNARLNPPPPPPPGWGTRLATGGTKNESSVSSGGGR